MTATPCPIRIEKQADPGNRPWKVHIPDGDWSWCDDDEVKPWQDIEDTYAERDRLREQVAALTIVRDALRSTPAPADLPEGVRWAMVADGGTIERLGWEWRVREAWWQSETTHLVSDAVVEVRPPSEPATEEVPWWEALRDNRRSGSGPNKGHVITSGGTDQSGPWLFCGLGGARESVDCDGMVTVLREGES